MFKVIRSLLIMMVFERVLQLPNIKSLFLMANNQGVFVKHYAPSGNKVQKDIFSFKAKVKVTRYLTLVSLKGRH